MGAWVSVLVHEGQSLTFISFAYCRSLVPGLLSIRFESASVKLVRYLLESSVKISVAEGTERLPTALATSSGR